MKTMIQTGMAAINIYSEYFLGLIVSITIARNLPTEQYGVYSSIIWVAAIISLLINSGLSLNVTKFMAEFNLKKRNELPAVLGMFWKLHHIRIIIVTVLFLSLLIVGVKVVELDIIILIFLFICAVVKADYVFRMAIYKGIQKFDVLAKTSLLANPFNITAVLICAFIAPTLENFVLVYCLTCLCYGFSSYIYRNDLPTHIYDDESVAPHKKRILVQMLASTGIVFIGTLMFKQSQVIILEKNHLLSEAGFFNIGFVLASAAITLVPGVYKEVLLPKITRAIEVGDVTEQIQRTERYLITMALLVIGPVVLYADIIVELLFGEKYLEAALALQWIMIFQGILILNYGANITLISKDKQVSMVKAQAIILIIAFCLSIIIVPRYALEGALFTYGFLVLVVLLVYKKLAKKHGYLMIPISVICRLVIASIIAIIPSLIFSFYFSGVIFAILGSLLYISLFVHLLFITGGYDNAVKYFIVKLKDKSPRIIKNYLNWGLGHL